MRTRSYHVYSTALVYLTPRHPQTTSSHVQTVKKGCDRVIRSCSSMQMPKLCSTCQ